MQQQAVKAFPHILLFSPGKAENISRLLRSSQNVNGNPTCYYFNPQHRTVPVSLTSEARAHLSSLMQLVFCEFKPAL